MMHLSIPPLKVQAAVIAVRLTEEIIKEHEIRINSCIFWSDSTTVLQWIHSSYRKQQVFVLFKQLRYWIQLMFQSGDMWAVSITINQSNEVTSFLQIVPVSIQSGGNRLSTYVFLDSGSTVSFIDQSAQGVTGSRHQCDAQHSWHTRNKGSEDRKNFSQMKGLYSKVHLVEAFAQLSISLGSRN